MLPSDIKVDVNRYSRRRFIIDEYGDVVRSKRNDRRTRLRRERREEIMRGDPQNKYMNYSWDGSTQMFTCFSTKNGNFQHFSPTEDDLTFWHTLCGLQKADHSEPASESESEDYVTDVQ